MQKPRSSRGVWDYGFEGVFLGMVTPVMLEHSFKNVGAF
jgi:hypothetical protein